MVTMSRTGVAARVVATLVGAALLLMGTAWGTDDLFPFGPFRMYAGVNGPDEDAPDPRVEGTEAGGRVVALDEAATGIRRAEVEEDLDRYIVDPRLLTVVADAYARRHPRAGPLVEVRLVVRWHEIRGSRPTGRHRDVTLAVWSRP